MFERIFLPADILLPKKGFETWSVIACDQYTSDASYWEEVERKAACLPSALHITFPEIYLSDDNRARIAKINSNMRKYLNGDVFQTLPDTYIYVERETSFGIRRGIVGRIDLQAYDFTRQSNAMIRATEATVTERVPPRVEIRKDAPLEIPHVMLFIDDPDRTVIEPLADKTAHFRALYDFDLMMKGGHIAGYQPDKPSTDSFLAALDTLSEKSGGMLFAVGDGNHSLAAAKESYALDPTEEKRYALVEIVNLHDPAIVFEPIYRVVFGINTADLLERFRKYCQTAKTGGSQKFTAVTAKTQETILAAPTHPLAVGTLQTFLDGYLGDHPSAKIDYIHGETELRKLSAQPDTVGFLFEGMQKEELFPAVRKSGSLPRKTFSMGTADEKRFYLEARKL